MHSGRAPLPSRSLRQYLVLPSARDTRPWPTSHLSTLRSCFLNPLYDVLPRNSWLVEHSTCQRQSDFLLDEATGTLCCPSPDNCCPNSARACQVQEETRCVTTAGRVPCPSNASWVVHYQGPQPPPRRLHHRLAIDDL